MRYFYFILGLLCHLIIAAQAEYQDWDLALNALGPNLFDEGKDFDIFQPSGDSDIGVNVGSLASNINIALLDSNMNFESLDHKPNIGSFYDENDSLLFSSLPNDACNSSPIDGKARRRSDHESCGTGTPDLSIPSARTLEKPGEYEQSSCTGGGFLSSIAFLVCSSSNSRDSQPASFTSWTLYQSTRGTQVPLFPISRRFQTSLFVNILFHASIRFIRVADRFDLVFSPQDAANCYYPRGLFCCDQWTAAGRYPGGSLPELSYLVSSLYSIESQYGQPLRFFKNR